MHNVIVVPPSYRKPGGQITTAAGELIALGPAAPENGLTVAHPGVPRDAGEITAHPASRRPASTAGG